MRGGQILDKIWKSDHRLSWQIVENVKKEKNKDESLILA